MPTNNSVVTVTLTDHIPDLSIIQNVQGRLNEKWKVDGWISLSLSDRTYIIYECNNEITKYTEKMIRSKKM